jgi:hypothetical protein
MTIVEGATKLAVTSPVRTELCLAFVSYITPTNHQQSAACMRVRCEWGPSSTAWKQIHETTLQTIATKTTDFRENIYPCTPKASSYHTITAKTYCNGTQRLRLPALWHRLQHRQNQTAKHHILMLFTQSSSLLIHDSPDEPESGAWSTSGRPGTFAVLDADEEKWAECEDCEDQERRCSVDSVQEGEEHLAGWGCRLEHKGYSGGEIGAEEMRVRPCKKC